MNTNKIPSIESIMFYADAFILAARKLTQPGVPDLQLVVAQIVNSSFASELYLKCIILIETGDVPRGHDLAKLFDKLKRETKDSIESKWNTERAKRSAAFDEIDRRAGSPVTARTLLDALTKEGRAFEIWRYGYEPRRLPNFSLGDLPAILREHVQAERQILS